jgi:hypothetical protein
MSPDGVVIDVEIYEGNCVCVCARAWQGNMMSIEVMSSVFLVPTCHMQITCCFLQRVFISCYHYFIVVKYELK